MANSTRRHIKTLTRRKNYLQKKADRWGDKNTSKSYDAAEISALASALEALERLSSCGGHGDVASLLEGASYDLDKALEDPLCGSEVSEVVQGARAKQEEALTLVSDKVFTLVLTAEEGLGSLLTSSSLEDRLRACLTKSKAKCEAVLDMLEQEEEDV